MAEFYLVLKKAVGGLHPNTTESRRGVYEKARNALVAQLKGISPPLSAAEISRRRLEMEEAIRRVERENAEALQANFPPPEPLSQASEPRQQLSDDRGDWPPPPPSRANEWSQASAPAPRRSAGDSPPRFQQRQADYVDAGPPRYSRRDSAMDRAEPPMASRSGLDEFDSDRRGPQAFEWAANERRDYEGREGPERGGGPAPSSRRRASEAEARRAVASADEDEDRGRGRRRSAKRSEPARPARKSRLPSLILLVLFLGFIGLIGFVALQNREAVARVIKDPRQIVSVLRDIVSPPTTTPRSGPAAGTSASPTAAAKVDGQVAPPVRQILGVGDAEPVNPAGGEPTLAQVSPVPDLLPAGPVNPAPAVPTTPLPAPVTQKVTFIEESATAPGQISATLTGQVVWSMVDGTDGPTVQARVTVPDRRLELTMLFHKNNDATASHQIDINVSLGVGSAIGAIDLIPTIVFKSNDRDAGSKLAGRSIKIVEACASQTASAPRCRDVNNKAAAAAPGVYWVALSPVKADVATNMGLLREKSLIDLPIAYKSGQRAIVTIEKGSAATAMFTRAMVAWGN